MTSLSRHPALAGALTINALVATDKVIVPVQANYLSLMGMEKLFETIVQVKRWYNPSLSVDGILITMLDKRSNFAKEIVNLIHMTYGGSLGVFGSEIPLSVKMAECSAEGKSIYEHDPNGKAAQAYMQFTKEVLRMEKSRSAQKIKLSSYEDIFKPENLTAPPEKLPSFCASPIQRPPIQAIQRRKDG